MKQRLKSQHLNITNSAISGTSKGKGQVRFVELLMKSGNERLVMINYHNYYVYCMYKEVDRVKYYGQISHL